MSRLAPVANPILLALYPVLFLYSHNYGLVTFDEVYRSIFVAAGVGALLLLAAFAVFRNVQKAGILASALVALIAVYGPMVWASEEWLPSFVDPLSPYLFVLIVGATMTVGFLVKTERDVSGVTTLVFLVSACLVASSLVSLASSVLSRGRESTVATDSVGGQLHATRRPDIYYIVLDGYGRGDVLENEYGLDNSPFLGGLEKRGFYVADASRSNYIYTMYSLTSALNMMHLDVNDGQPSYDFLALRGMIQGSRVVDALKTHGYKSVVVPSGFHGTDPFRGADVVAGGRRGGLNEFEMTLLDGTILSEIFSRSSSIAVDGFELHRRRVLSAFGALTEIPDMDEPMFVFAHVVTPHPPFVFDRNGEMPAQRRGAFSRADGRLAISGGREAYRRNYAEQVRYLNGLILETVDAILSRSTSDNLPIIIIQGDHGPASHFLEDDESVYMRERAPILNAYFIPPDISCDLYESITPVNTFRVVFDGVFGTDLGRLPDTSWVAYSDPPAKFFEIDLEGRVLGLDPSDEVRKQAPSTLNPH